MVPTNPLLVYRRGTAVKILITGITGFAGSHLAHYLKNLGDDEIAGLSLSAPGDKFARLFDNGAPPVHCCDITDTESLTAVMQKERPDAVVHMAARAQVANAWQEAVGIVKTNVVGAQALMQAVHNTVPQAKVLLVSSGEVYGSVLPEELPLSEDCKLRPNNPYSVSKAAQELIAMQYHAASNMEVVIARPFNHIGPRQVGNFVVPAFAKQIAEIEAGLRKPVIKVGNLDSQRDFTDVRDTVRAYHLLLTKGWPGEAYNIASGTPHPISGILAALLRLSQAAPKIERIPELMRPSDTPVIVGDSSKLRSLGDWRPLISLEQSLKDTLDYWREQTRLMQAQGSTK